MRRGSMARTRRSTIAGSGGATRGIFVRMMEGLAHRRLPTEDDHDRRDLSEGAPHGIEPAG